MATEALEITTSKQEKEIYNTIARLQRKIFGAAWGRDINQTIQEYAKLLQVEVTEMLMEVNFRLHKPIKEVNKEALKEEIVDVFIYAQATASTVFESYEEFIAYVEKKTLKNQTRSDWEVNK
ncbi:MAG TPA: hypothetical protein VL443_08235 [Cyclobacteriaceae bacterium]|jgi:hypothetical protein|nr:hypothetical protein [Cyclobacteriaceae bacterium]